MVAETGSDREGDAGVSDKPTTGLVSTEMWQQRLVKEREWQQTPLGAAFIKFEIATQRYWQEDGNEHVSDERLTALYKACREARAEFLMILRGW